MKFRTRECLDVEGFAAQVEADLFYDGVKPEPKEPVTATWKALKTWKVGPGVWLRRMVPLERVA